MNNCRAAGTATSQDGIRGSRANMADAKVDAYTKCVSNMRSVSQVKSAWNNASCTGMCASIKFLEVGWVQGKACLHAGTGHGKA